MTVAKDLLAKHFAIYVTERFKGKEPPKKQFLLTRKELQNNEELFNYQTGIFRHKRTEAEVLVLLLLQKAL